MIHKLIFIILLSFLVGFSSYAQNLTISGKVTDTLQQPLGSANILAVPKADNVTISFAITLDNGTYKLKLQQEQNYEVTVSYLVYLPQTVTLNAKHDLTKNFILQENPNQLD